MPGAASPRARLQLLFWSRGRAGAELGKGKGTSFWARPAGSCFKRGLCHARLLSPARLSPLVQSCGCCLEEARAGIPPWASEDGRVAELPQALSPLQPATTGPSASSFLACAAQQGSPSRPAWGRGVPACQQHPPWKVSRGSCFHQEKKSEFATAQPLCSSASALVASWRVRGGFPPALWAARVCCPAPRCLRCLRGRRGRPGGAAGLPDARAFQPARCRLLP